MILSIKYNNMCSCHHRCCITQSYCLWCICRCCKWNCYSVQLSSFVLFKKSCYCGAVWTHRL